MITKEQQNIIDFLRAAGHGYGKFATSVMRQGWVSDRQMLTMQRMKSQIEYNRHNLRMLRSQNRKRPSSDWSDGLGCSDSEAMSMGEYF